MSNSVGGFPSRVSLLSLPLFFLPNLFPLFPVSDFPRPHPSQMVAAFFCSTGGMLVRVDSRYLNQTIEKRQNLAHWVRSTKAHRPKQKGLVPVMSWVRRRL